MREINVPTLIIHGIHDKVVPFSLGQIQNQSIVNSKLVPFEFSGHASFYDEQDRFNEPTPVFLGFPCDSAGKETACNVGDLSSIPGFGKMP